MLQDVQHQRRVERLVGEGEAVRCCAGQPGARHPLSRALEALGEQIDPHRAVPKPGQRSQQGAVAAADIEDVSGGRQRVAQQLLDEGRAAREPEVPALELGEAAQSFRIETDRFAVVHEVWDPLPDGVALTVQADQGRPAGGLQGLPVLWAAKEIDELRGKLGQGKAIVRVAAEAIGGGAPPAMELSIFRHRDVRKDI
jgi:hypothetical protein